MFDDWVRGKQAWKRATLSKLDYFMPIPSGVHEEISAFVKTLRTLYEGRGRGAHVYMRL